MGDGIQRMKSIGVCAERMWPYDTTEYQKTPPASAYDEALSNLVVRGRRLHETGVSWIKTVLMFEQRPLLCGFLVPESFMGEEVRIIIHKNTPS